MSSTSVTIFCAFLGATGLFNLIMFFISRRDKKKEENSEDRKELKKELQEIKDSQDKISNKVDKIERDSVRGQLLTLIADYPDDVSEIMKCAEYYFKELDGNWFATPIFVKYLKQRGIAEPEWLFGKISMKK